MELTEILHWAVSLGCSDIFIIPGAGITAKQGKQMITFSDHILTTADTEELVRAMYGLARRDYDLLSGDGDDDFSFALRGVSRFRCNAYRQRGSVAAVCRIVYFELPDPEKLNIPSQITDLAKMLSGMVLVTGPAGSGKSTTLACIIDRINAERQAHIITIEDPIEYLHKHKRSLVSQREIPNDAETFSSALRSALRQAPDVIMLGEMRDLDTIRTAITAAETGHLLLSSLHTIGASRTVDRMVDTFPAEQQPQTRMLLSMVLKAVVSQRMVPTTDGKQIAVFEVMTVTPAIQTMIREGRTHQIDNAILNSTDKRMISMDNELLRLFKAGQISRDTALLHAVNPESLSRRL